MVYLRPEMKSIAKNCMPEVVLDLPYDFMKMLGSFAKELASWLAFISGNPS